MLMLYSLYGMAETSALTTLSTQPLLQQAERLPEEFRQHVFDVPLATRVEKNGKHLGDALVLLSRAGTVQLLQFTEHGADGVSPTEQARWETLLSQPQPLGQCGEGCPSGLLALHFSLENAQLTLVTTDAGHRPNGTRYQALPTEGSQGLVLNHTLNLASDGAQPLAGHYGLDMHSSLGQWSGRAQLSVDRSDSHYTRYYLPFLYAQRETAGHFLRAGLFSPHQEGLLNTVTTLGRRPDSVVGVMAGHSDVLLADTRRASLYPIYVTANRDAVVEIYRDGVLINTQHVSTGLQLLNTEVLPVGIYPVEVRVVEDGVLISRTEEMVYKPSQWRDPQQRWRYSIYAGQQRTVGNRLDTDAGDWAMGGSLNYLLHPRATLAASAQRLDKQSQFGAGLDWAATNTLNLYANLHYTPDYGRGYSAQAAWRYAQGSITVSQNQRWREGSETLAPQWSTSRALSLNHRLDGQTNFSARLSQQQRSGDANGGLSVDLGLDKRSKLHGHDATWRVSLFDRTNGNSPRNRGVEVSLSLSLGGKGRFYSASLGNRNSQDGRDLYASASVRQEFEDGWLRSVGASTSPDRYGIGLNGNAQMQSRYVRGDVFVQRSSKDRTVSGGLNLQSTTAFGGGAMAASGDLATGFSDTGMIVEVDSDLPQLTLQVHDSQGASAPLRAGRNFIPVRAYQPGQLLFDFAGQEAPAVSIKPSSATYHLNQGGVAYQKVKISKTVTVLGRLRTASGELLGSAHILNHSSRGVSESTGFFSLEMSESSPTLDVRHPVVASCRLEIDLARYPREQDTLLLGDVSCPG